MNRISLSIVVFALCLPMVDKVAFAQKANSQRQDERRENERVAKANKAVADAKKDIGQSHQELRNEMAAQGKAATLLQQQMKKLRDAREAAEDRLGAKVGIPDALAKARQASKSFELIANKIRDQVHATPQWVQANQVAEEAKKKKTAILEDVEQTGNNNEQQLAELAKKILKPLALEDEAIANDASAIEATELLAKRQSELDDKRKLLPKGEVDRDPNVVKVLGEVQRQEKMISDLEIKIRKVRTEASKIQKRYSEAIFELQKAKSADAADPNRPKKNNNGKPA